MSKRRIPSHRRTLKQLERAGYCIEDFARWCQGNCMTYARTLISMRPGLRLGTLDQGAHFFAHDDQYAYDATGRHALPHCGLHGDMEPDLDIGLEWYGTPESEEGADEGAFAAARGHALRNQILEGRRGANRPSEVGSRRRK